MAKRRWRRIIVAAALLALAIAALDQQERYTSRRKLEAFSQRVSPITEGMAEAEVRRIAGAPEEFVARLSDSVDPSRVEWCVKAGASTAMIYSVDRAGWLSSKLRIPVGISSRVICLDANRRVVKIYASFIDY
jgi:hypothetical protein